jgi:hypothetical protein
MRDLMKVRDIVAAATRCVIDSLGLRKVRYGF